MLDNAIKQKLTTMKHVLIGLVFLSAMSASCQIHWEQSTDWTLYQYEGNHLFSVSIDSLKFIKSSTINQDSMAYFVQSASILNKKGLAWMGGYIATCKINGVTRKVEISNYGGFFYDQKSGVFYQLPIEKIDAWLDFLQNAYITMINKKD
jgi:hypothetical protein